MCEWRGWEGEGRRVGSGGVKREREEENNR